MRSNLEEAEELLVLSRSVLATATSRLARAPMLLIPQEIAPAPPAAEGDEDPENDPFLNNFTKHLERAIEDPAAAASLAPYVLYAQSDWLEKIRPITLHDTTTDYMERDLRIEAIARLARGLDLPPEVVNGMSSANHWAAWWISDDMWRSHGAPIAEQFCDDLSEAYLRPALRDSGEYADWENVVVGYDASGVVVNPDRSKDADQAWDRGAINYKAYRNAKNFTEQDAQTDDEHAEWLAIKKVIFGPRRHTAAGHGRRHRDRPRPAGRAGRRATRRPAGHARRPAGAGVGIDRPARFGDPAAGRGRNGAAALPRARRRTHPLAQGRLPALPDGADRSAKPDRSPPRSGGTGWSRSAHPSHGCSSPAAPTSSTPSCAAGTTAMRTHERSAT